MTSNSARAHPRPGRWVMIGLLLAAVLTRAGEPPGMPPHFWDLEDAPETPHIPWARPAAGPPLRVLVIAPRNTQRQTVELRQRLDCQATPFFMYAAGAAWLTGGDWGLDQDPRIAKEPTVERLRQALAADYDAIVLVSLNDVGMPADVVATLAAKVRAGTGLVAIYGHVPKEPTARDFYCEHITPDWLNTWCPVPLCPGDYSSAPARPGELPVPSAEDELRGPAQLHPVKRRIVGFLPFARLSGYPIATETLDADLNELVNPYAFGQGRVVFLWLRREGVYSSDGMVIGPDVLFPGCADDLLYEYSAGLLVRAVRWAARREPGPWISAFPAELAGPDLELTVSVPANPPAGLRAELAVRGNVNTWQTRLEPLGADPLARTAPFLEPLHRATVPVPPTPGEHQLHFNLPPLPPGDWYCDVRLFADRQPLDWAAAHDAVTAGLRIEDLRCTPEVVDLRQDYGPLEVSGRLAGVAPVPGRPQLEVRLEDGYDRLLWQGPLNVVAGAEAFAGTIPALGREQYQTTLLRVHVTAHAGDTPLAGAETFLTVLGRPYPFFFASAWAGAQWDSSRDSKHRFRLCKALGYERGGGASIATLRVADMRFESGFCQLNRHAYAFGEPAFGDLRWRQQLAATIRHSVPAQPRFPVFNYTFGSDEPEFRIDSARPFYVFRTYLRNVYGDVGALNAAWATHYAAFEAIPEDEFSAAGQQAWRERGDRSGNYAPLLDRASFQYAVVADLFRFVAETLHEAAPDARLSLINLMWNHAWRGYNHPGILPHLGFYAPYAAGAGGGDLTHVEAGRSFARPDCLTSQLIGSYYDGMIGSPRAIALGPHNAVLEDARHLYWYNFSDGGETGLAPSMALFPPVADAHRELDFVRGGLAELVEPARPAAPQVAVLYSLPSVLFAAFGGGGNAPQWDQNAVLQGCRHLGLDTRFVLPEDLPRGRLQDFRILCLPSSQCLDDAAATAIADFVRAGGILIADQSPPACFDEHGRRRPDSALAAVLGVSWDQPPHPVNITAHAPQSSTVPVTVAGRLLHLPLPAKYAPDPALRLTTGTPTSDLRAAWGLGPEAPSWPLLIHHRYGQGHAFYLNCSFGAQPRDLLAAALLLAGAPAPLDFGDAEPFIEGFRLRQYTDGEACYFGLLRATPGADRDLRLPLPRPLHVYDMQRGAYLGVQHEIALTIPGLSARWFAALPYRVTDLDLQLARRTPCLIACQVTVRAGDAPLGRHVLRLDVLDHEGRALPWLMHTAEAAAGQATFLLPIALNEDYGRRHLSVRDLASGTTQNATVPP